MNKLNKPEQIAKNIVDNAYELFVNPGKWAGKNFDKELFEIDKWIESSFFLSYI